VLPAFTEPEQDKKQEQEQQVIHYHKNSIYLAGFAAEKGDVPQAGEPPYEQYAHRK
jgi:hypothetical protein